MRLSKLQLEEIVAYDRKARESDVADDKNKVSRKSLRYNYIVKGPEKNETERELSMLHVAVKLAKDYTPRVKVIGLIRFKKGKAFVTLGDVEYRFCAGWCVYWSKEDFSNRKNGDWDVTLYGWEKKLYLYKFGTGTSFPWHDVINKDEILQTKYKYCGWSRNIGVGLVDYLVLYNIDKRVEILVKHKLYTLVKKGGIALLKDRKMMDFVRQHADEIRSGHYRFREISYAAKSGTSIEDAQKHFEFVTDINRYLPRKTNYWSACKKCLTARIDYARLRKLIPKWGITNSEYGRYVDLCLSLGEDDRCEGILYPPVRDGRKTFMSRLERLEYELNREEAEKKRARRRAERKKLEQERAERRKEKEFVTKTLAVRMKELETFQNGADRVLDMSESGYTCVVAKTREELIKEGRRMNNCLGYATYGKGVVRGDTLILMFKDRNGKSYCDVEIDRSNWTVRQCYLKGNALPDDDIRTMAEKVAAEMKKVYKKNRRNSQYKNLYAEKEKLNVA